MLTRIAALMGTAAVFAALFLTSTTIFAQSGPNATTRLMGLEAELSKLIETDEMVPAPGRPRIIENTAEVKASIVAKNAAVSHAIFDLINHKRLELGAGPLKWSDDLARVANVHSQNMAEFNFFSHRGLDNKMVSDRADDEHLGRWRAIGENIAFNRGYSNPVTRAVEQWLNSPDHRKNLLDPNWRESAVGVALADDGSYYFTQVFLRK